jgi:glycosyltransferase involved in cell wall biosynthesis
MASKKKNAMPQGRLPLVSIITPSYNQAKYISRTIRSVETQDYQNIEHIVIDGGSKDGTVEILKKHPKLSWVSEKDSGQSNAINKGFRMARGEIVAWLNSDDTYEQGAVSAAAEYLSAHPEVAMIYSRVNIIDENDREIGEHFILPYSNFIQVNIANCVPQQGAFFRKSALKKAGLVDERLHYVMDHELWIRIGKIGRIAKIPGVWSNFRIVAGTKTSENYDKFFDEMILVCGKHGGFPLLWVMKKYARKLAVKLGLLRAAKGMRDSLLFFTKN